MTGKEKGGSEGKRKGRKGTLGAWAEEGSFDHHCSYTARCYA